MTAAPAPTFEEAGGKAAAQIRSAQAAFKAGSYDRAVAAAQAALREDPANEEARKVLANAQDGQKALACFGAAEAALARETSPRPRASSRPRGASRRGTAASATSGRDREAKRRAQQKRT